MDDDSSTPRSSSIAGATGTGVTKATPKPRLDPSDPSTWTSRHNSNSNESVRPRTLSSSITEAQTQQKDLPKISVGSDILHDIAREDHEDIPKVSPPPPKQRSGSGSLAAALSGNLDSLRIGPDQDTQNKAPKSQAQTESDTSSAAHLSPPSLRALGMTGAADGGRRGSVQSAYSMMTDDSRDDDMAVHSSDEEREASDDDEGSPLSERGRKRQSDYEPEQTQVADEEEKGGEEVKDTQSTPVIQVDAPPSTDTMPPPHPKSIHHSGKLSETHGKVTPRSNYNRAASPAALSTMGDDNAELQRAKSLLLRTSPIDDKITDRHVKMLIRGDWSAFQDHEDVQQEYRHEPRLYLVCTDLSNEATYALEWTLGTLLKDGDTLLIISALEDENATKHPEEQEATMEIRMESAKAAEEATTAMVSLTRQTTQQEGTTSYNDKLSTRKVQEVSRPSSRQSSRSGRLHTKKDDERIKAVDKLETDFLKFVRRTTLQIRCMIEVIHCRSPRHLILNAIDELEPTLVVVGTRGLGAVKNVMMGSFSNYLVQKSSIPVMVARKRLKKPHHAKISSQQIRMTNNLTPSHITGKRRSLTQARID